MSVPALVISILAVVSYPAYAGMSEWVSVHGGAVHLISSGPIEDGRYRAGIEFAMDPGWHTYWRFPGEAGIPPMVDFSASGNVKQTEVLYPVPSRYSDGFSSSIVYHDAVVLPVLITPEDATQPTDVSLSLFFGVCKDICVPGDALLSLSLLPDGRPDTLSAKLIDRDMALVPGKPEPGGPQVLDVASETDDAGHRLIIHVKTVSGGEADLFAEGPEGSYIALPVLREQSQDSAVFTLSTNGLVSDASGSNITFVLKDGPQAVEQTWRVDASLLPDND